MDYNNNILIEAKTELTEQFIRSLAPPIFTGFQSMYDDIIKNCKQKKITEYLTEFQQSLKDIPNWSSQRIKDEYYKISSNSDCDYLQELLTGVLVTTARVLSTIGTKTSHIDIKIPKIYKFVHQCYIYSAREFWKFTYLFNRDIPKIDIQRNMREAEKIIENSIKQVIRTSLPVQSLLKEYLTQDEDTYDADLNDDINKIYQNNLKNMLRKNLETLNLQSHREQRHLGGNDSDNDEHSARIESLKPLNDYLNTPQPEQYTQQSHKNNTGTLPKHEPGETKFDYSSDDNTTNLNLNHHNKDNEDNDNNKNIDDNNDNNKDKHTKKEMKNTEEYISYDKTATKLLTKEENHRQNYNDNKTINIPKNKFGIGDDEPDESNKFYDVDIPNESETEQPTKTKKTDLEALFKNI